MQVHVGVPAGFLGSTRCWLAIPVLKPHSIVRLPTAGRLHSHLEAVGYRGRGQAAGQVSFLLTPGASEQTASDINAHCLNALPTSGMHERRTSDDLECLAIHTVQRETLHGCLTQHRSQCHAASAC